MSQSGKAPVPKFGSFKPKGAPKHPEQKSEKEPDRSKVDLKHRDHDEHREHRRHGSSDRMHHRKRDRHDASEDSRSRNRHAGSSLKDKTQDEFEESDTFIIDKRGDVKNVEYGSLHRYSIPAYHRIGQGHVVGADLTVKIDRDASTEKEVVLRSANGFERKRNERLLTAKRSNIEPRTLRLVVPSSDMLQLDLDRDYLELRPNLKRKRGSDSPGIEPTDAAYRSIEHREKASEQPQDEDLEYASSSDIDPTDENDDLYIRQENASLSKKAKDNPQDVDIWLALIDYQSKIIRPGADAGALTNTERRTLADIRLSIYNRALKHILKNMAGRERLLLGSIQEGTLIWETSELQSKWSDALKECPTSSLIWTSYLDFIQTNHVSFRYEKCKEAYIDCLKVLAAAFDNANETTKVEIDLTQTYVLLRFTTFVRDAGYEELAYAMWQILLEYHFFRPDQYGNKKEELESLEEFWESDVPRIGEEGAVGWNQSFRDANKASRSTLSQYPPPLDKRQTFDGFAKHEIRAMSTLQLPATLDDDPDSDDPFRHVMFTDLQEVVEHVLNDVPRSVLLNAFLCFMHLPPLLGNSNDSTIMSWHSDAYLRTDFVNLVLTQEVETPALQDFSLHHFHPTNLTLFSEAFLHFHNIGSSLGDCGNHVSRFVDRVLHQIVMSESEDYTAEYYLAFKLKLFPLEVPKDAKRILKARPSSLRLYNAYALIEAHLGRLDKAEGVWSAALGMSKDLNPATQDDSILLWHSWMSTLIRDGNESAALACLISACEGPSSVKKIDAVSVSAGTRLKAVQYFEAGFEQMCSKGKPRHAALYIDCLGWLSYLVDDRSLETALGTFAKYLSKAFVQSNTVTKELLYQAKATIIKIHVASKRPYKPAVLWEDLSKSISQFPENSMIRTVYTQIRSQNRIDDRIREAAQHVTVSDAKLGLIEWSFAISEEIRRTNFEASGSTSNSVRSRFSTALQSPDGKVKHSPVLWTMWLLFESQQRSTTISENVALRKTKEVFFEGLRHLPWSKPWIMIGITCLARLGASDKDMSQVYDLMSERELRIRHNVDR